MKKKMIAFVAFAALMVFGLGMVDKAVAASSGGGDCHCFDEAAAWQVCESLCSFYQGSSCMDVGPAGISGCDYPTANCNYVFWSYCIGGGSYRRQIATYCGECEAFPW